MRVVEKMRYDVSLGYEVEDAEEGWEKVRVG